MDATVLVSALAAAPAAAVVILLAIWSGFLYPASYVELLRENVAERDKRNAELADDRDRWRDITVGELRRAAREVYGD